MERCSYQGGRHHNVWTYHSETEQTLQVVMEASVYHPTIIVEQQHMLCIQLTSLVAEHQMEQVSSQNTALVN